MNIQKFKGHFITDTEPTLGCLMICVRKNDFSYGKVITNIVPDAGLIDKSWKVILPQSKALLIRELVTDTKTLKKEFEKIGVHWSIEALLDSVIEKNSRVVFDDMRSMCLQLLPKDK